jgi:hypothetical protein
MITLLTSELNRINQGCNNCKSFNNKGCMNFLVLCPTCQKEKETLKKVSIMWADEELKRRVLKNKDIEKEIEFCEKKNNNLSQQSKFTYSFWLCDNIKVIKELQEIKSLMEKA